MTRTFRDAGVLITAARGVTEAAKAALLILDDPEREFASSAFVRLEVLPKAAYNRKMKEAQFYETYFDAVTHWADDLEHLVQEAGMLASQFGLSAMDALHTAAALLVGAEEFITTEQATKPIHRVTGVKVITLSWESVG
jgi:predicted nucleic acid-binding protein